VFALLFLLFQGALSAVLTCDVSINKCDPKISDCRRALQKIKPGRPRFCPFIFKPENDAATFGSCTIHTYSAGGRTLCLSGDDIIKGVKAILNGCVKGGNTAGQYQFTDNVKEGVRLISS